MPEGNEIMMPVTTPEAASLAASHAWRQMADSLRVLSDVVINQGKAQADHSAASTRAMSCSVTTESCGSTSPASP